MFVCVSISIGWFVTYLPLYDISFIWYEKWSTLNQVSISWQWMVCTLLSPVYFYGLSECAMIPEIKFFRLSYLTSLVSMSIELVANYSCSLLTIPSDFLSSLYVQVSVSYVNVEASAVNTRWLLWWPIFMIQNTAYTLLPSFKIRGERTTTQDINFLMTFINHNHLHITKIVSRS